MSGRKQLQLVTWPVGHGLFTQANLEAYDDCFRIVYDCGTKTKTKSNIERVLHNQPVGNEPIDLLVISHFDLDHVSHIGDLLASTGGAHCAWIPYLSPQEALLYAIATCADGISNGLSPADFQWYLTLVTDPVGALRRAGVRRVVQIGKPGQDDESGFNDNDGIPPRDYRIKKTKIIHRQYLYLDDLKMIDLGLSNPRFSIHKCSIRSFLEDVISLRVWTKNLDQSSVSDLRKKVLSTLGASGGVFSGEWSTLDMNKLSRLTGELPWLMADLLRSGKRGILKNIYNTLKDAINSRSLCLLAQAARQPSSPWMWQINQPIIPDTDNWSLHQMFLDSDYSKPLGKSIPTILWTGDVNKRELDEMMDLTASDFRQRLSETIVWQVPHHGSSMAYCPSFYSLLYPCLAYVCCRHSISTALLKSRVVSESHANIVTEYSAPLIVSFTWE